MENGRQTAGWPITSGMDASTETGEWVRIPEAAKRLEVSERTMRRWFVSGRYPVSQDENGVKLVFLANDRQMPGELPDAATTTKALVHVTGETFTFYQAELTRTRRTSLAGWSVAAALVVAVCVLSWYATREHGRAQLAEQTAVMAQKTAADAVSHVLAERTARESIEKERRQATEKVDKWQTKAEEATARAHDLELQMTELQAEIERDRLAQAIESGAVEVRSNLELTSLAGDAAID